MRILLTGSNGLIGTALLSFLRERGDGVIALARKRPPISNPSLIFWNPGEGLLNPADMEGFDAVVHLAGENIADGRWTPEKKRRIYDSRIKGTALLSTALAACTSPPKVLVCSSAVGYYGNRGDEVLEESAAPGTGFLADTCRDWEAAAQPVTDAGIRTISLRTGMVLSGSGGALPRMLFPFRLGLGGPIGCGGRWMSWIALEDMVRLIVYCLEKDSLSGPVNAVAPHPVLNREFTRTLGCILRRPAILPIPPPALQLAFGEMARELLLSSARVVPKRLEESGFAWGYPRIEDALRWCVSAGR